MKYTLVETSEEAEKLIGLLSTDGPCLTPFDIETTGLDPYLDDILLIQFQRSTGDIYILNCRKLSIYHKLEILKKLWKNGEGSLLGHNLKFDLSFLMVKFPSIYFDKVKDTFITETLIVNGIVHKPASLAELIQKYLGMDISKEDRKSFIGHVGDTFSKKQLDYCARDIVYLKEIYKCQQEFLRSMNLGFIEEIESRAVPAIAKVQVDGIFLNYDKWQRNQSYSKEMKLQVIEKLNKYAATVDFEPNLLGVPIINWSSPAQVLGLVKKIVDPTITDTSEKTLELYSHEFIDLILELREHHKLITSYGDSVLSCIHPTTGRVHPNFQQIGAKTGRMSCREPNIQQVPKISLIDKDGNSRMIYRESFTPQESTGRYVGADYSSFELRVLTDLTREPEWIKGYTEDLDMHSVVAAFVFGVPVSKKENPELRDIGKSINFGIAYGMGPKKLQNSIQSTYRKYGINKDVSIKDASDILKKFYKAFGNIKSWQDTYVEEALSKKLLVNPYDGRILSIEGKDYSNKAILAAVSNECKNFPCQSTNATVIKLALVKLQKFIFDNKLKVRIVNVIHDELLCDCLNEEAAIAFKPIVKKIMEESASYFIKSIPVKAEPYIGTYWKK